MNRSVLAVSLSALLVGCAAVGPDYQQPSLQAPKQWSQTLLSTIGTVAPDAWWTLFHDPVLNDLMREALAGNLDLQQTAERVTEARLLRNAVIAAGLPTLGGRSNVNRRLNNTSSSSLGQSGSAGSSGGGFGVGSQMMNIFQLGVDAQWELDFFGGVRRALEAAEASVEVAQEQRHAVQVTLLAEVARHYIDLRSWQQQLQLALQSLQARQALLDLTQSRQHSGLASMLDVTEAQAQMATVAAQLPVYRAAAQQAIHALSVLLAQEPAALNPRLQTVSEIPVAHAELTALPSDLLLRRPDIRQAERQLAVANAQIGIATADLYPKVNLAGFLGIQNIHLSDFTPVGKSWSTAASLSVPLFNWGKINANIKGKESQYRQAQLAYQQTVLTAFQEVEDALVAYIEELQRNKALQATISANELALQLAQARYGQGLSAFLDVLQAQTRLLMARDEQIASSSQLSLDLIRLYKALGGGWQL